jgi:hypothetical protein
MACALFSGATLADNTQTSSTEDMPSATIELSGGAVAAGIGFQWGHGDVVFQGQKHRFSVSGLSIVDVGASSYSASGLVYNLHNINDLNGNFTQVSAGMTIAGGGSADYLRNEKGVVIKLLESQKGLRFNLSASGMKVQLQS